MRVSRDPISHGHSRTAVDAEAIAYRTAGSSRTRADAAILTRDKTLLLSVIARSEATRQSLDEFLILGRRLRCACNKISKTDAGKFMPDRKIPPNSVTYRFRFGGSTVSKAAVSKFSQTEDT